MVRLVPLALLALFACGRAKPRPGIPPRHALLITIEGLRADHCSAYLYHRDTTTLPFDRAAREAGSNLTLDELAQEGTLFTQAFAPTGHSLDSLAALHTGRHADLSRPPGAAVELSGAVTLAAGFRARGMQTLAFVTSAEELPASLTRGFERCEVSGDDWETVGRAIAQVDARDWGDGRGMFMWVHLAQPAAPYWPVTPEAVKLEKDYTLLYADPAYDGERDGRVLHARAAAGEALSSPELRYLTDLYDGELALTDYVLYYFLDYYRYSGSTSGAWESTVTVVVGTSGAELGARAGAQPWETLHDSGLRVPLLLRHPDSLTGRRIFADLVTLSDVASTLAEWFQLEAPVGGRSLLAITDSYVERTFPRSPVVASDGPLMNSLRTEDWRLITTTEVGRTELYRVERMQELEGDVADAYPEIVSELMKDLGVARAARTAELTRE